MKKVQKTKKFSEERYWRIRMKDGDENLAKDAWERNRVGIWYGGWSAKDWVRSLKKPDPFKYLSELPQPSGRGQFKKTDFDTAKRFAGIVKNDWVVVFFDDSLHLARIHGGLKSNSKYLKRNGEIFKYRKIVDKKSFQLGRLPDSYRLIPSAGRANVHEFSEARRALIKFLAENKDENAVVRAIKKMPFMSWLDLLGPAGWESFCLGYLIITEGFLPTGLGVGRTLPTLDIVGRNKKAIRIVAQCKKNPESLPMPTDFINACRNIKKKAHVYFFAYGGITESPKWVKVRNRKDMERWVNTGAGRKYAAMFHQVG